MRTLLWYISAIMLKPLAILALLYPLATVGILAAQNTPKETPGHKIAKQETSKKRQGQPHIQGDSQAPQKPPATDTQPTTPGCDEACQQGRESLRVQNRLAWLTGGLVLVGLLQVGSMVWQGFLLRQTRGDVHAQAEWMKTQAGHMESQTKVLGESVAAAQKGADAADENAKAALAQIQMVKATERARVAVEVMPIEKLDLAITGSNKIPLQFRNLGLTRAFNVRAEGDARPTLKDHDPPPFEMADLCLPIVIDTTQNPCESWVTLIFPEEWFDDLLLRPRLVLEVRGIVQYDDVFGDHHFTKFAYDMGIPRIVELEGSVGRIHPFSHWYPSNEPDGNEAA